MDYGLWWRVVYERSGIFHVKHWYAFTSIDEWVAAIAAVVGLLVNRCSSDAAWYGWLKRMMYERSGIFHVKHW